MNNSKVVLVTGTSSGFGLLTATHLASKGHQVIATMRNLGKQHALINEAKRLNCELKVLQLDVTDKESIDVALKEIAKEHGYLDVVINNAGYGIGGFFEDLSDKEIRDQMEVNFFGVQNVTRAVLPMMRSRKSGKIINISSVAGFSTSPAFGAYNASKWALEGFSESLYYELKPFGIQVYLIQPGTYKTKIFSENARYAKNFDNDQSPYFEYSQFLKRRVMKYVDDCYKDPNEISRLVEKLINRSLKKFRHIPDLESKIQYTLRKLLPFGGYRALVEKGLYKDFKKS